LHSAGSSLNAAQNASKALSGVSLPLKVLELIIKLGYVWCPRLCHSFAHCSRSTFFEDDLFSLSSKV